MSVEFKESPKEVASGLRETITQLLLRKVISVEVQPFSTVNSGEPMLVLIKFDGTDGAQLSLSCIRIMGIESKTMWEWPV